MDKASLEEGNGKGVVLRNGFIECLRRKPQTQPKGQLGSLPSMPGYTHPARSRPGLVTSSSGRTSTRLQSGLRGSRQLQVTVQVLALCELSFRFLCFLG